MRRLWVTALVAMAAPGGTATAQASHDEGSRDAFVQWVRDTALPIEKWELSPAHVAYLDRALMGKRIVFLGESDHGIHEKYDVQAMLVRHLATRGFVHVFHEGYGTGLSRELDRCVREGGDLETVFRPVDLDAGHRDDRSRFGLGRHWSRLRDPELRRRSDAERVWYFGEVQRYNAARPAGAAPLSVHPLDVDSRTHFCKAGIHELLEPHRDVRVVRGWFDIMESRDGESIAAEAVRLTELRTRIERDESELTPLVGNASMRCLSDMVDCLVASTEILGLRSAPGNRQEALTRRESFMFEQFRRRFEALPEQAKVVVIGHNVHLSRDSAEFRYPFGKTVGTRIAETWPDRVFSLWLLFDRGRRYTLQSQGEVDDLKSDPDRIESVLAEAGSTYLLPLHSEDSRARYLAAPRTFHASFRKLRGTLPVQADAVLFLDQVTELQDR